MGLLGDFTELSIDHLPFDVWVVTQRVSKLA